MSDFGELIKELAVNAVEAEKPVEVVFGIVEGTDPLKISLEQKLVLDRNFIDVLSCASYKIKDKVVLLRCAGGQKYVLLDSLGGD